MLNLAGLVMLACLCGARDEQAATARITCWKCGEAGGMRPRPVAQDMTREVVR